jgi:hypothetical protein
MKGDGDQGKLKALEDMVMNDVEEFEGDTEKYFYYLRYESPKLY